MSSTLSLGDHHVMIFGGKGGVGKTSCAAAASIYWANSGLDTLILSSDLEPSLSDIFEISTLDSPNPKKLANHLWGIEIKTEEVMRRWKLKYGPEIYAAASALVDMEYEQVVDYVALAPGIQEEFLLEYIHDLAHNSDYERIVWDTAPAGDTLRLLGFPEKLLSHLRLAPRVYMDIRDRFNLSQMPFSEIIASWSELSARIKEWLCDRTQLGATLVTIPESLAVYQTERLVSKFTEFGIHVDNLIINRVLDQNEGEYAQRQASLQKPNIRRLRHLFDSEMTVVEVPAMGEIRGMESIFALSSHLTGAPSP